MRTFTDPELIHGFSLLEVLLTITLMSVMVGVVTINASKLVEQAEARQRLMTVATLIDSARRQAISEANIVRLSDHSQRLSRSEGQYVYFDETVSAHPSGACEEGFGWVQTPGGQVAFKISGISCKVSFNP